MTMVFSNGPGPARQRIEAKGRDFQYRRAHAAEQRREMVEIKRRYVIARVEAKLRSLPQPAPAAVTPLDILTSVCRERCMTVERAVSITRSRPVALVRHEIVWRCRTELGSSWVDIGRFLGKDHTTVISGFRAYERRRATQ